MTTDLNKDLQKLQSRAFGFVDWVEHVIRRYYSAGKKSRIASDQSLRKLCAWMFVPPSLWPFNVRDVFETYLSALEKRKNPSPRHRLLVDLLPEAPDESINEIVANHELHVQRGEYENLVRTQTKYSQNELATQIDPELDRQWKRITTAFKVEQFREANGVIRRSMVVERNLRPSFSVNMAKCGDVFQAAFDAFCLRWNLYGMQNDEPLPMKLTVNLTAYGTMIHIPAYWSFDPKRDIRWDAIAKLHRARVPGRQGAALAEGVAERRKSAAKLPHLDKEVLRLGLKGHKRHEFLCKGLGLAAETSPKRIRLLRAEFKHMMAVGKLK